MDSRTRHWSTIGILGSTQVLSWGSLYYAFTILAHDIGRELHLRAELVFGAFSWCLLVAGLLSTPTGILLDRYGGRRIMAAGSLLCGAGFMLLSQALDATTYFLAWTVLGAAMSAVLYEAAFATLNHQFGLRARKAISSVTLFGGFASSVFWPLTLQLNLAAGWRKTYLYYGLAQLLLCLPLHLMLVPRPPGAGPRPQPVAAAVDYTLRQALRHPSFWKLAFAFAANSFVFSALSVHLIPILQHFGHPLATVVFMAAMIGPMQVLGRVGEMAFASRTRPQTVGKLCFAMLPGALLALLFFGSHQGAVALFCILYGLSNGILTIVRGTVPQALFGERNYGAISGALSGPSLLMKAAGPLAIAAVIQFNASPVLLFGLLFACAMASLLFYMMAVRTGSAAGPAASFSN